MGSPGPATSTSQPLWMEAEAPGNNYLKEAVEETTSLECNYKSEGSMKASLVLKTRETPGTLSKDCHPPGHGALEGQWAGPTGASHTLSDRASLPLHWTSQGGMQDYTPG